MTIKSRIGFKKQYIIIENNAFQLSIEQEIEDFLKKERVNNLELKGYRSSIEKKLRLHSIVYAISGGIILFPKNIDKELFNQLVDYGLEGHDDLSDAFAILCSSILSMDHNKLEPRIRFLG
jgi:phage terminase large subunit-like protein